MRYIALAALVLAVGFASPVTAGETQSASSPTFDDCFRLAWVRGVHVERDELGSFNELCMANKVPFESGNPVTSIRRGSKQSKS